MKSKVSLFTVTLILILSGAQSIFGAVAYECTVSKKLNREIVYSADDLKRSQFSAVIIDSGESFSLKRCSFILSKEKVTCDEYTGDKKVLTRVRSLPPTASKKNNAVIRDQIRAFGRIHRRIRETERVTGRRAESNPNRSYSKILLL